MIKTDFVSSFRVLLFLVSLFLYSCGGSDSSGSQDSEYYENEYYETESDNSSYALNFRNAVDVHNYLNDKTFSSDGLEISFKNNAQMVYVNGTLISGDVKIFDIGVNNNNVAYATVQIANPASTTTTLTLLAVQDHAQLIDPNDGTVYEY